MDGLATRLVEWAGSVRPGAPGGICAAAFSVVTVPHGVLVAVSQAIRGGPDGAAASRAALAVAQTHAFSPLPLIVQNCHRELADSPGVALSLALFDVRRPVLWWLGIGHLPGYIMPPRRGSPYHALPLVPGVVGRDLPPLAAVTRPLVLHDTLIVVTDSVRWDPARAPGRADAPLEMANRLVDEYGSPGDDVAAVAARYLGLR